MEGEAAYKFAGISRNSTAGTIRGILSGHRRLILKHSHVAKSRLSLPHNARLRVDKILFYRITVLFTVRRLIENTRRARRALDICIFFAIVMPGYLCADIGHISVANSTLRLSGDRARLLRAISEFISF